MQKGWLVLLAVALLVIPIASAPVWYGSGDDTGLVGRWSCEGGFKDSSGQGNNGTQSGGVTITRGVKGRACGFDGSNDFTNISDSASLRLSTGNFTISLWLKTSDTAGRILTKRGPSSGVLEIELGSGLLDLETNAGGGTGTSILSSTITDNSWHHLAFTRNGTTLSIYKDGSLSNSTDGTIRNVNATDGELMLGADGKNAGFYVQGLIDETRIYNRRLTATEISSLYDTGKTYKFEMLGAVEKGGLNDTPAPTTSDSTGLVGYWKMDDLTNGNTTDSSGQGNNGSVIGATFASDGRWNGGYNVYGTNDYIQINHIPAINFTLNSNYSVSFWFKSPAGYNWDSADSIVEKWGATTYPYPFVFRTFNNSPYSIAQFAVWNGTVGHTAYTPTTVSINDGRWHHIVGTKNGTTMQMYGDGVFGSAATITAQGAIDNPSPICVGIRCSLAAVTDFNGSIDEIRIYNRSLSASEVMDLYLSKGLVGYWRMDADQRNTTDTYDSSGYYNHGKITGATFTNEGRFKEGYKFDGVNDYVNVADANSLDLQNFTIALWVNPVVSQSSQAILVNKPYGGTEVYTFYMNGLRIRCAISNGTGSDRYFCSGSSTQLPINSWSHVVMKYDSTNITMYINGVQDSTENVTRTLMNTATDLAIGRFSTASNTNQFNGTIDEVRVYNRALTADDVLGLYQGTKSNKIELLADPTLGGMNETPTPEITDSSGLVGWWKMNDLTNGNTTDNSGQGNNGVINGAALNSSGRWDKGYIFDGSNDYINAGNNASLNIGINDFTACFWHKKSNAINTGSYPAAVSKDNCMGCNSAGYQIIISPGDYPNEGIFMKLKNGTTFKVPGYSYGSAWTIVDTNWHHVCIALNRTSTGNGYLDGRLIASVDISAFAGCNISNSDDTRIGRGDTTSPTSYYFNGSIDEVRIYNRALSPSEVQEIYLSKGLVGYWKMNADQKNSTSTFDTSGYYNHGFITGATLTNEGRFKEGYKLDGINDVISMASGSILNLTGNMTLSAWIKWQSADAYSGVVGKTTAAAWDNGYGIYGHTNGYLYFWGGNYSVAAYKAGSYADNQWHHVAGTYNGTTNRIWVDGVEGTPMSPLSTLQTAATMTIGRIFSDTYNFNGTIDEVRVYNRALTSDEVLGLYQGTKTNEFAWWSVTG